MPSVRIGDSFPTFDRIMIFNQVFCSLGTAQSAKHLKEQEHFTFLWRLNRSKLRNS